MILPLLHTLLAGIILAAGTATAQQTDPRQVILLIGDGMDDQQVTIARNYLVGARGRLLLDKMPLRSSVQILATADNTSGKPIYVSDSANTATSMSTGAITSRGRIATSAGTDRDLTTIVELAAAAGLRTGLVSTASVTDATVAAFAAHINSRRCENPESMVDVSYLGAPIADCSDDLRANGGPGSISEQLARSPLDLLLGGGHKHFAPQAEGEPVSVEELARQNGFTVITSAGELSPASSQDRLLGLFAPDKFPVRLQGEDGREAEAPVRSWLNHLHPYLGSAQLPAPMTCEANPAADDVPSLKQMTEAALERLQNDRGFFLMVESASIDKQAHERKPCGSIGELQQLEEALASILDFARDNPGTLVMVTADHAQAAQLIPDESLFSAYPIPAYSPGKMARIITPEGGIMAVNYATTIFLMEEHTGATVPLYANAEGAGLIAPYLEQPDIFTITRRYLGL